jgi:hypothetical protein
LKKNKQPVNSKISSRSKNKLTLIIFAAVFGIVGFVFLFRSFASTPQQVVSVGNKGQNVSKTSFVTLPNKAKAADIKPGGTVKITTGPLRSGRYNVCYTARAVQNVPPAQAMLTLDADNSTTAKELKNNRTQYSIRFTKPNRSITHAQLPVA